MREILFRGKQKDNGKWIEGYLVNAKWYLDDSNTTMIVPKDATLFPRSELSGWEEVISETVGQFTGMLDKNGKRIFEGDIVYLSEYVKKTFDVDDGAIIYSHGAFFVNDDDSLRGTLFALTDYTFVLRGRVVGNVYDNPELLEVK